MPVERKDKISDIVLQDIYRNIVRNTLTFLRRIQQNIYNQPGGHQLVHSVELRWSKHVLDLDTPTLSENYYDLY